MNHEEIETIAEKVEKLDCQIEYIEDHYEAELPRSAWHSQWESMIKRVVILNMQSYQLIHPDAELQLHESGMQFREINQREPAPYGYSN